MTKKKLNQQLQQELMEKLAEELMKDRPQKAIVKQLSLQLGIPCSGDQLTDIDAVLHSMGSVYLRSPRRREPSQVL